MQPDLRHLPHLVLSGLLSLVVLAPTGCSMPHWQWKAPACVLDPGISKEELVNHLNSNIRGNELRPGLTSWRSGSVRLRVNEVPVALPASIAVQAPRNLRLLVSNPLSQAQEVDIGSNDERFWIWFKGAKEVMTTRHEDVSLALSELEIPVHIHPDWLMEVFGVIPLDASEFQLRRPQQENGLVELVAQRQSPLGEDVERVLRVNLCRGCIVQHELRLPGGKVLARASIEKYSVLASGTEFPSVVRLEWPDARKEMVMEIHNPEINPASLTKNVALWQMPNHGPIVDIGLLARQRVGGGADKRPAQAHNSPRPGRIQLSNGQIDTARPTSVNLSDDWLHERPAQAPEVDEVEPWAREVAPSAAKAASPAK
jgi:hypothetical protein